MRTLSSLLLGATGGLLLTMLVIFGRETFSPPLQTMYCRTGAGPMVVDGFDIHEQINPIFSDVHELVWKLHPSDRHTSSAALQPPVTCSRVGIAKASGAQD